MSTPGAAVFGRDMLFDIPYIADWNEIGHRRQAQVRSTNKRKNNRCLPHDYAIGEKVLIIKDGILQKAQDKMRGLTLLYKCIAMVQLGYKEAL